MDEKIIRLAVYSNAIEAEMAKNYLADAGVTVFSAGGEVGGPFVGFDAGFASIERARGTAWFNRTFGSPNRGAGSERLMNSL